MYEEVDFIPIVYCRIQFEVYSRTIEESRMTRSVVVDGLEDGDLEQNCCLADQRTGQPLGGYSTTRIQKQNP